MSGCGALIRWHGGSGPTLPAPSRAVGVSKGAYGVSSGPVSMSIVWLSVPFPNAKSSDQSRRVWVWLTAKHILRRTKSRNIRHDTRCAEHNEHDFLQSTKY